MNIAYIYKQGLKDTLARSGIIILTLTLAALFFVNIASTQIILHLGGAELNPAMVGIVSKP